MSKVIKNNDGVAVVEGTPAASLVKDVDKFFTIKPPKRMAGEAIKPQKLDTERLGSEKLDAEKLTEPMPVIETLKEGSKFAEPAMKTNVEEKTPQEKEMKREEAVDKTKEFKRLRFAERSAEEQEATRGSFISTLQT
tara:strand:+ start:781 stop:1191 length:411 start_codon:yes stop_codon:yes gene_type:complete